MSGTRKVQKEKKWFEDELLKRTWSDSNMDLHLFASLYQTDQHSCDIAEVRQSTRKNTGSSKHVRYSFGKVVEMKWNLCYLVKNLDVQSKITQEVAF